MSRRRSKFTPLARSDGPLSPKESASSALMCATFFRRLMKMRLPVSRSSYSSTFSGKVSRNFLTLSKNPSGGGPAKHPLREQKGAKRRPPTNPSKATNSSASTANEREEHLAPHSHARVPQHPK